MPTPEFLNDLVREKLVAYIAGTLDTLIDEGHVDLITLWEARRHFNHDLSAFAIKYGNTQQHE